MKNGHHNFPEPGEVFNLLLLSEKKKFKIQIYAIYSDIKQRIAQILMFGRLELAHVAHFCIQMASFIIKMCAD